MQHRKNRGRGLIPARPDNGVGNRRPPPPREGEDDAGAQLGRYWQVLRTRRLLVLGVFLLVFGATAAGSFLKTPIYRATGMIELRQPGDDLVPVDALFRVPQVSDQHLETQYALLMSPVLARRVAQDVLMAGAGTPWSSGAPPDLDEATRWVRQRLSVDPLRGSRLVRVSFEAADPDLAARVVNSMFSRFSELRVEAARGAVERLTAQGDTVRARLSEAERRLQEYVREHELLFLESGSGESENLLHERLQRLQQELTAVEADRYAKEALYNLVSENEGEHLDSGVLESLNVRVAELRSEYARLRSTFTDDYPRTEQVRSQLEELESLAARERGRVISRIRNDHRAAVDRERLLRSAFEEQKRVVDGMAGVIAEYHGLRREVAGHLDLHADLQQKRKEAEVSAAAATTEFTLVEAAVTPQFPVRPVPKRDLPLGVIVGLALGIGLAFLREYTDTAVNTAEELHSVTEVPILGIIPSADPAFRWRANGDARVGRGPSRRLLTQGVAAVDGRRLLAEAFGGLRTSVLFDMDGSLPRSLLITSSQPGEGKTTVSVNLAMSLAKLGRRTLLIDADTRRPAVHSAFGIEREAGLTDHLEARGDWREMVVADAAPCLDVLPAGRRIDAPSDALSSPRMQELVDEVGREYDFVIIDSPALMINAADTRTLAPLVDGVLLVVRSGATPRETVRHVVRQTPGVIGVVLNDLDVRKFTAYYGEYDDEEEGAVPGGSPREEVRS